MSTIKKLGLLAGLAVAICIVPASRADISNQATQMTFAQPVSIPGRVLPAGTYWFTVLDDNNGLTDVTRIYNADHTKLLAQQNTQYTDKATFGQETNVNGVRWPTGKLVLTVAEPDRQPAVLLAWYYPGRTDGHRFVYSTQRQKQLDEEQHQTIAVNPGDSVTIGPSAGAFE